MKQQNKKITSRNVENLFKELIPSPYSLPEDEEMERLEEAINKRENELARDPKLVALQRKMKTRMNRLEKERGARREKVLRVRKYYYAEGLSPRVAKMVVALVEDLDKEKIK